MRKKENPAELSSQNAPAARPRSLQAGSRALGQSNCQLMFEVNSAGLIRRKHTRHGAPVFTRQFIDLVGQVPFRKPASAFRRRLRGRFRRCVLKLKKP